MKIKTTCCILFSLVFFSGCSRSQAYKQEQEYFQPSEHSSGMGEASTSRMAGLGQPKKKVYVLAFLNDTPMGGEDLGDFAAEELLRLIRSTGKAVVPEGLRFGSRSDDYYTGNKVRLGLLTTEAKKHGLSMVVVGKIKRIIYRKKGDDVGLLRRRSSIAAVDLEMRMFDVTQPREVLFDEKSADSSSSELELFSGESNDKEVKNMRVELVQLALRNGMKLFSYDVSRALEKFSWEGRIAKVSAGKIYINAGKASGLNIGDILKVLTGGEDIYDPATGAYLGRSPGQVKGTLEVVDYLGADGAVANLHSGNNVTENDIVQLY